MHEVSTWQLLKIYSLSTQQVEKNANTLVGLHDFSHAVTAPLNFQRADTWACLKFQLQKNHRKHTNYSKKITLILSENRYLLLMYFTMKMNRIPNNTVPQR